MQLSDEDFYVVREKDILSVASMSKEVQYMYESFLYGEEPENERKDRALEKRKAKLAETQGYIGKINEARILFEKLYKN